MILSNLPAGPECHVIKPEMEENPVGGDEAPRTVLIVNTKSRRGQESFEQARALLEENGVSLASSEALEDPSTIQDIARRHIENGAKRIIIGGGDGSFRCVARLFAETGTTLGVLPLGTVNDLARNLGIAPDIETACKVIAAGCICAIDVGMANEDCFLITASLGFSAIMQKTLTPGLKKIFGPLAYLAASLLSWRRAHSQKIQVVSQGINETMHVMQAGVISGHMWMGGRVEIPGIDLESGKMAFYAVPRQPTGNYWRMARHLRHGDFFQTPGLWTFTARDVQITTRKRYPLVLDGDLCGHTPVRFRVYENALRVLVPAAFQEGSSPAKAESGR